MSNILITGVASGFGRLTAQALLQAGHRVAGSMRDLDGRNRANAEALTAMGCHVVELDVTDDASTTSGVEEARRQLGAIDVVVNNAGIGALGLQEAFTPGDWRNIFEINVFGVQRVARAVLPSMRERGQGLLNQIPSLTGRFPFPFQGPYCASKWAAEALADLYRLELTPSGVESCIVEPGGFPTEFLHHLTEPSDSSCLAGYGEMGQLPDTMLVASSPGGLSSNSGLGSPSPGWSASTRRGTVHLPRDSAPGCRARRCRYGSTSCLAARPCGGSGMGPWRCHSPWSTRRPGTTRPRLATARSACAASCTLA